MLSVVHSVLHPFNYVINSSILGVIVSLVFRLLDSKIERLCVKTSCLFFVVWNIWFRNNEQDCFNDKQDRDKPDTDMEEVSLVQNKIGYQVRAHVVSRAYIVQHFLCIACFTVKQKNPTDIAKIDWCCSEVFLLQMETLDLQITGLVSNEPKFLHQLRSHLYPLIPPQLT